MSLFDYSGFLRGPARPHWERIGARRRAGVCVPLFSLHSAESLGIGEIPDLIPLVDWCARAGLTVLQLLPLNDVGYDFAPYSAKSGFALDPMYLSLRRLIGVDAARFGVELRELARGFPIGGRVNYGIKAAKVALLWRMFEARNRPEDARFHAFKRRNAHWLRDDALYKVLKGRFQGRAWEEWEPACRDRSPEALAGLAREEHAAIQFHEWVQWQLFEQFQGLRRRSAEKGVLIMGDIPFLTARDSADVWAHPESFKLRLSSGAPPDLYFAGGQRWGMPPYDWGALESRDYGYVRQKLHYAEQLYDLYRIDHVIGVFRVYTIPLDSPPERQGLDGVFDPPDEGRWEDHGRRLLEMMLGSTTMLPCGEDLGTVPPCSYKVLSELSIPGLDVLRWARDWGRSYEFKDPGTYRLNSVAVASTHDMSPLPVWWRDEVGTVDDHFLRLKCLERGLPYERLRDGLFDAERSAPGRLRWREGVDTEPALLSVLNLRQEEAQDFLDLYRSTRREREIFSRFLGLEGPPPPLAETALVARVLEKAGETASVFSIQLLQDWLAAGGVAAGTGPGEGRINLPGSVGDHNWSCVLPLSVEDLGGWEGTALVREVNLKTGRLP